MYGIPASSIRDLHHLLSWMELNKFAAVEIKRARCWIDSSETIPLNPLDKRSVVTCTADLVVMLASFISFQIRQRTPRRACSPCLPQIPGYGATTQAWKVPGANITELTPSPVQSTRFPTQP
ncbi:hypothetical protein ACLFKT_03070 [Paraburkholderia sp. BR14261]